VLLSDQTGSSSRSNSCCLVAVRLNHQDSRCQLLHFKLFVFVFFQLETEGMILLSTVWFLSLHGVYSISKDFLFILRYNHFTHPSSILGDRRVAITKVQEPERPFSRSQSLFIVDCGWEPITAALPRASTMPSHHL